MMELRHLRYFLATVETGSVSGAAAALHVTQPGLSRQLRQLEAELGIELFNRTGGRLTPSKAGLVIQPMAADLLARAEAIETAAALLANGRIERITIGAPSVTLTEVVAPFVATLAPEDPAPDVVPADGLPTAETLRLGADLAIGTATPPPPYVSRPLAVFPVWACVPATHRWAGRGRIGLGELLREPLIGLPESFTARQSLESAVARARASYVSLLEAANGTVAQALAAAGRGIAVVSDDPRFGLCPLIVDCGDQELSVSLVAAWDSRHPAAAVIEDIAQRLGRFVRDRYDVPAAPVLKD
jgi:LysR family transcriptional regulator, benzoate and cis,cis-muconate-responsive activator of ben and cat genes